MVLRSVYFMVKFSICNSRVMGLYSSNCRRFFVCRTVNWEPLGQFTSNFTQLLELIVLRSVYFLVKFWFFIQELWERKSLQILYECWRRAYHELLAQLFILSITHKSIEKDKIMVKKTCTNTIYKYMYWRQKAKKKEQHKPQLKTELHNIS